MLKAMLALLCVVVALARSRTCSTFRGEEMQYAVPAPCFDEDNWVVQASSGSRIK